MTPKQRPELTSGDSRDGSFSRRELLAKGSLLAGAISLGPVLAAGGQTAAAAPSATRGVRAKSRTLVVGHSDIVNNLDPDGPASYYEPNFVHHVNTYAPPFTLARAPNPQKYGGGWTIATPARPVPGLITDWGVHENGWVFQVRKGVKSVAGNELTAEDFVWTFNRNLDVNVVAGSNFAFYNAVSASVIDKYKYEITTTTPAPGLILVMAALPEFAPIDSVEAKKHATSADPWAKAWLAENNAGFGPYVVTHLTKGQEYTLTARDDYYGGTPYFKKVTVVSLPDTSARYASLYRGDIDLAIQLPPDSITAVKKRPGLKVVEFNGNARHTFFANYKFGSPALQDRRVHQALAYAIPYQDILSGVYLGRGSITKTLLTRWSLGATDKYWHYQTSVANAKKLLAQAGWSQGFPVDLFFPAESAQMQAVGPVLQNAWAQIGVATTLNPLPTTQLLARQSTKKDMPLEIIDFGAIYSPDPASLGHYFTKGSYVNIANYQNPTMDATYDELVRTVSKNKRKVLSEKVQEILARDLPEIGLLWFRDTYAMKKTIQNYTYTVEHMPRFFRLTES
jgi:peptide/nickel transport system substrate-binding protein